MDKTLNKIQLKSLMLLTLTGLLSLPVISNCAFEPTYRGQKIQPAYPEMVKACSFVGEVTGSSNVSYTPLGRQYAKYRAMDEAGRLGATHIVWEAMTTGVHPTAYGRAYRCE
jgi:hypothetical protein